MISARNLEGSNLIEAGQVRCIRIDHVLTVNVVLQELIVSRGAGEYHSTLLSVLEFKALDGVIAALDINDLASIAPVLILFVDDRSQSAGGLDVIGAPAVPLFAR